MIVNYYKTAKDDHLREMSEAKSGCLVVAEEATKADIRTIVKLIGLRYADLRDALDDNESPRLERDNGTLLIFLRHPANEHRVTYTEPVTVVLSKDFTVVIVLHKPATVQELFSEKIDYTTAAKGKLLVSLLLKISQQFSREIKHVADTVSRQKKEFRNVDSNDIIELARNEEILNQYLSALVPMRNVVETVAANESYLKLEEEDADLLQDVLIGIRQSVDVCTVNLTSIRSLRDSYQIIFTNDLNRIIKLLTVYTIVLTIPTTVASIYGMNIVLPLAENPSAFVIVLMMAGGISALMMLIFRLKKWI